MFVVYLKCSCKYWEYWIDWTPCQFCFIYFIAEVWEYIQATRDQVQCLESRLQKSKDNIEQITKIMSSWSKAPLFERLEIKGSNLLYLADREEKIRKRYDNIRQQGETIHELLQVSLRWIFNNTRVAAGQSALNV